MTRYDPLYTSIAKLEANHKPPDMLPSQPPFPFKTIYRGQQDILDRIKPNESFCHCCTFCGYTEVVIL